jgi:hypothetical protein
LKQIFAVLNGADGKITVVEYRINLLQVSDETYPRKKKLGNGSFVDKQMQNGSLLFRYFCWLMTFWKIIIQEKLLFKIKNHNFIFQFENIKPGNSLAELARVGFRDYEIFLFCIIWDYKTSRDIRKKMRAGRSAGLFLKPLNRGIFSVIERFIEDYLRNLTCWQNSKNRFRISAPKLIKIL